MQDTALVLVETQAEWFSPEGRLHALAEPDLLKDVHGGLQDLLAAARAARLPVVHAHLRFEPGHLELGHAEQGLRHAIKHHDVWSGAGAEPAQGLAPADGERVVTRTGASAFSGSSLDSLLRHWGVRRLLVAGMAAHVCVLATVMQAHDLGYTVVLPRETTEAFSAAQRQVTLEGIVPHFARVEALAAVLEQLARRASLVEAVERFLAGLRAGDPDAVAPLLAAEVQVEGSMEGRWCRWDRDAYLERVRQLGASIQSGRLEHVALAGDSAEVDTRVQLPHGEMHDRLSWLAEAGTWRLHHKGFQLRQAAAV